MRVAAIDCGTNSIRLLIADVDPAAGTLDDVDRRMEVVRLGEGVDRTGRIGPQAMARTLDAARRYAELCEKHGVEHVRFVATSASRDAENAAEFTGGVLAALGVQPEVIAGEEEAALSFAGATRELHGDHASPYLVVDLGGGSTEFVLGGERVEAAISVDIGCVRLTERHLHDDPPAPAQVAAAAADIAAALDRVAERVPLERTRTLVGLAGSITTVTAHALRLPGYDPVAIHRSELPATDVRRACADLLGMPRSARAALPFMHPGRVDVIGAGALIWDRVVERVAGLAGITATLTSEHDILDGIALSVADAAPV
jgi:exopolyphosphatase/guanosine-5'-triphosphate,3'-diphosphate pyrophosphatase